MAAEQEPGPIRVIRLNAGSVDEQVRSVIAEAPRWVGFMVEGDAIEPGALDGCRAIIEACPTAEMIYGDAVRNVGGERQPLHRPAWSPHLLRSQMYVSGLWLARGDVVARVGSSPITGLHDLALRVAEQCTSIVSVPRFLCEIDDSIDGRADAADVGAVDRHVARVGLLASATSLSPDSLGFVPQLTDAPLVSIVVPTGGTIRRVRGQDLELVFNAVRSVCEASTYENIEVVVVIDHKSPDALGERLLEVDDRVRVVRDTRPFNFAATTNLGVEHSSGSVVVLLNDDTEVVTEAWLERLISLAVADDVGAVGVRLLYGDGRLQHGGVVARDGSADHLYHGHSGTSVGHHDVLVGTSNPLAVTGACLALRRDRWDEVGGMDERLPLNYNDVDLCLRLASRGWRTVFDGSTVLMHLETSSRPHGSETWEHDIMAQRWATVLSDDPFDNPNLRMMGVSQCPPPAALSRLRAARGEGPDTFFQSRPDGLPEGRRMPVGSFDRA